MGDEAELGSAVLRLTTDEKALLEGLKNAKAASTEAGAHFSGVHNDLKTRFAEKFEHIGVHTFGHEMLGAIGITGGMRPILGALSLAVNSLGEAFGFATGPIGLFVMGFLAAAAVIVKVHEGHEKHKKELEELIKKQDEELKTVHALKESLEEYETTVGRMSTGLKGLYEATRDLDAIERQRASHLQGEAMAGALKAADTERAAIAHLKDEIISVTEVQKQLGTSEQNRIMTVAALSRKITEHEEALVKADQAYKQAKETIVSLGAGYEGLDDKLKKQTKSAEKAAEANKKLGEEMAEAAKSAVQFGEFSQKMSDKTADISAQASDDAMAQITQRYDKERMEASREFDHEQNLLAESKMSFNDYNNAVSQMAAQREQRMSAITATETAKRTQYYARMFGAEKTGNAMMLSAAASTAGAMASKWSSNIAAMLVDGQMWRQNFVDIIKDIARTFIAAVTEMMIRWIALQAVMGIMSGGSSSLLAGSGAAAGGVTGAGSGMSLFGGPGAIPMRAAGGDVSAGSPYWVGERGPELFVPSSSGSIVPNGAAGGPTVTQSFSFTGMDFSSSEAARKIARQIAAEIRRGAIDALSMARAATDQTTLQPKRAY